MAATDLLDQTNKKLLSKAGFNEAVRQAAIAAGCTPVDVSNANYALYCQTASPVDGRVKIVVKQAGKGPIVEIERLKRAKKSARKLTHS